MPVRRSAAIIPITVLLLALLGAALSRPAEVGGQTSYEWNGNELTLTLDDSGGQTKQWLGAADLLVYNAAVPPFYFQKRPGGQSFVRFAFASAQARLSYKDIPVTEYEYRAAGRLVEWRTGDPDFQDDESSVVHADYQFILTSGQGLLSGGSSTAASTTLKMEMVSATTGTPSTPEMVSATRSLDFTSATISWNLYDPVSEYEIQREEATTVTVGDVSRIEYGNPTAFTVEGTLEGVDTYTDDTVEADKTYQYRVRAMGAEWGPWSQWVFVSADPAAQKVDNPSNLQLDRTQDNSEVTVSWTAPAGAVDNYTLQREEFVDRAFANVMAFSASGSDWLPGDSTTYTDSAILPGRTYRYRVAGVRDDVVGEYSEWVTSGTVNLVFAPPPENLGLGDSRVYDERREYWLVWDAVEGADEYELQVNTFNAVTGGVVMEDAVLVTDPTIFQTGYSRREFRVRGRKQDADLCGAGAGDRCTTEWTGWYGVGFVAKEEVAAPSVLSTPLPTTVSVQDLRADVETVIMAGTDPLGATVDAGAIVNFLVVGLAMLVGGAGYVAGRVKGMAPLGTATGVVLSILVLWLGIRLLAVPQEWGVVAVVLVLVLGVLAFVHSLRVGGGN